MPAKRRKTKRKTVKKSAKKTKKVTTLKAKLEKVDKKREDVAEQNMNKLNKVLSEMNTDMFSRREKVKMARLERYQARRGAGARRKYYTFRRR